MATTSVSLSIMVLFLYVATALSQETAELSQRGETQQPTSRHQAQKRSTLIEPQEPGYIGEEQESEGPVYINPYDDLSKRSSLFRFGKRNSLFRFGKRGGSLFRFGKRGGTLFRFGRSGPQSNEGMKRNSLFRFGKRADDSQVLDALESYYGLPLAAQLEEVQRKRNVNSFHWGDSE